MGTHIAAVCKAARRAVVTSSFSILVSEILETDDQQCLRDALEHRARHHICDRGDRNMEYESTLLESKLAAMDNDLIARVVAGAISDDRRLNRDQKFQMPEKVVLPQKG